MSDGIWQRSAIVCTSMAITEEHDARTTSTGHSRDLMKMLPLGTWSGTLVAVSCAGQSGMEEENEMPHLGLALFSILSWHTT